MVNTAQQIGGPIGTAVFSSLAATQSRTISMPDVETTRAKQQNWKVAGGLASDGQLMSNSLPSGSRMATP
jgi:hypothetical protein